MALQHGGFSYLLAVAVTFARVIRVLGKFATVRVLRVALKLFWSWCLCPKLSFRRKLSYLTSLLRYALAPAQRTISYLGSPMAFDNPKTPLILLHYPQDVGVDLLGNITTPIESVLDIGGNIGQFAATLVFFVPSLAKLDIFEPNPTIYPLLARNMASRPQVSTYNYGVGRPGQRPLFFVPDASSTASFAQNRAQHLDNATSKRQEVAVEVEVVSDIAAVTGRGVYDLIKIDVEGAEFEVLETLTVRARYLWLEVSGRRFAGSNFHTSELWELIRRRFGEFDILFQSSWTADTACDVLLEIVKPAASEGQ